MFIMMLVYIFFGLRCRTDIFFFFENYGLGLGLALFSLGIQVGPAMQKNFNLSWKFFQIFRAKLKSASHFKSGMVWLG
jgi:hypothetical protein